MSAGSLFPKNIKRITFLGSAAPVGAVSKPLSTPGNESPSGDSPTFVASRDGKKKKMSRGLRSFEKFTRRFGNAISTAGGEYVSRHGRSNRKKRDGWLRDYVANMAKANRKGLKKLRIPVFKL